MEQMDLSKVFPGWHVVGTLGMGSFGEIKKIERTTGSSVEQSALKVISIPQSASKLKELRSRGYDDASIQLSFEKEYDKVVKEYDFMKEMSNCPNTVHALDLARLPHANGVGWDVFIRMELLTTLKELPNISAVGSHEKDLEKQVIQVGIDICRALVFCENKGVLHRDIKPDNIFYDPNDNIFKLGDFGVAKISEHTMSGTVAGTYKFMAPEVRLRKKYGKQADLCSLGLTLHWLLNERTVPYLPLPSVSTVVPTAEDEEEAVDRRLNPREGDKLPEPAHGSPFLKMIVMRACTFAPEERYQSAEEMLKDLLAAAKRVDKPVPTRGNGGTTVWLPEEPKTLPVRAEAPNPPTPRKGLIAVLLVVILLLGGAGYVYFGTDLLRVGPTKSPMDDGESAYYTSELSAAPETEVPQTKAPAAAPTEAATMNHTSPSPSVPEPTPEPTEEPLAETRTPLALEWTGEWASHLPEGITGENSAIRMRLVFTSVPITTVKNSGSPGKSYIKVGGSNYTQYQLTETSSTEVTAKNDCTLVKETTTTNEYWGGWRDYQADYHEPPAWASEAQGNLEWREYKNQYSSYQFRVKYQDTVTVWAVYKRDRYDFYYNNNGWSEYTETPIRPKDDLIVRTGMQYDWAPAENGWYALPSMENFPAFDGDFRGVFPDVDAKKWYAPEKSDILRTVCGLGILLPDEAANFNPEGPVTMGQLVRATVMLYRIYNGYGPLLAENNAGYQIYADYAIVEGILSPEETTDLERKATRKDMVSLLSKALPSEELGVKAEDVTAVSDMDPEQAEYSAVLTLARAGIITLGEDGAFMPDAEATRVQLASVVDKLVYPEHR